MFWIDGYETKVSYPSYITNIIYATLTSTMYLSRCITNIGLNQINILQHQKDYLFGKKKTIGQNFSKFFQQKTHVQT